MSTELQAVVGRIRYALEQKNAAREVALRGCRETIRACSCAIRAIHRNERDESIRLLLEARATIERVRSVLTEHPDLYHAGYVHDAQKEVVEAEVVFAIVADRQPPTPEEMGVEGAAYLNGLAEAGSECRRYVLDRLREGDLVCAERVLRAMDDIYYELIAIDFPDAITGGLRRTTDAFRAVLERTRGDLTMTVTQRMLETALRRAREEG